ncbi:MAG: diheme cytochrome c [Bacillota bacterium]
MPFRLRCFILFAASMGAAGAALADGHHGTRVPLLHAYQQECSSCHVAYPPGMLPAASWQRLMHNLPRHFGTDASLDAATVQQLSAWLTANAGSERRVSEAPPQDRITRSAWFVRKHDEVPAAVWKRAAVKSPSNCAACHTRADQGDFDEDYVRIPR